MKWLRVVGVELWGILKVPLIAFLVALATAMGVAVAFKLGFDIREYL